MHLTAMLQGVLTRCSNGGRTNTQHTFFLFNDCLIFNDKIRTKGHMRLGMLTCYSQRQHRASMLTAHRDCVLVLGL